MGEDKQYINLPQESVQMTADNIKVDGELFVESDYINAYIEAWFDVDERFGTNTYDTDDYVNVCANYYSDTDELEVGYTLISDDEDHDFVAVEISTGEREVIFGKMRDVGLDECISEMGGWVLRSNAEVKLTPQDRKAERALCGLEIGSKPCEY